MKRILRVFSSGKASKNADRSSATGEHFSRFCGGEVFTPKGRRKMFQSKRGLVLNKNMK